MVTADKLMVALIRGRTSAVPDEVDANVARARSRERILLVQRTLARPGDASSPPDGCHDRRAHDTDDYPNFRDHRDPRCVRSSRNAHHDRRGITAQGVVMHLERNDAMSRLLDRHPSNPSTCLGAPARARLSGATNSWSQHATRLPSKNGASRWVDSCQRSTQNLGSPSFARAPGSTYPISPPICRFACSPPHVERRTPTTF